MFAQALFFRTVGAIKKLKYSTEPVLHLTVLPTVLHQLRDSTVSAVRCSVQ